MVGTLFKLFAGIAFIAFMVIIGPILIIWALNTLFPALEIPYTIETWAAAAVLNAPFTTRFVKK